MDYSIFLVNSFSWETIGILNCRQLMENCVDASAHKVHTKVHPKQSKQRDLKNQEVALQVLRGMKYQYSITH